MCLSIKRSHLFRAQPVCGDNLYGEIPGVHKPVGVEHDLSNHGIVGDHHGHSTEQNLT